MKRLLSLLFAAWGLSATAQQHQLEPLWKTVPLAVPESVLPTNDLLYVTLIDGGGWAADGKGGVAKLTRDGKVIDTSWITGLNAPKGMAKVGNKLYVADITEVVVIEIKQGKIEKKIKVEGAVALNDVTATRNGIIYVSDSRTGNVWRFENDVPTLLLDGQVNVNGLKAVDEDLYIGAGKSFKRMNEKKELTTVVELPQGIDGIEPVGNGDFILTSWGGWIYYVTADGRFETLLDTSAEKRNTADIGYDAKERILYVPTFNAKTVEAYRLK
jgi:sugar lactone lactonase YvrE